MFVFLSTNDSTDEPRPRSRPMSALAQYGMVFCGDDEPNRAARLAGHTTVTLCFFWKHSHVTWPLPAFPARIRIHIRTIPTDAMNYPHGARRELTAPSVAGFEESSRSRASFVSLQLDKAVVLLFCHQTLWRPC